MRVLMLSWEYPPKSVGGLAQHVYYLSSALVKQGIDVQLVTCGGQEVPAYEEVQGVKVHRVHPYNLNARDFITWILHLNFGLLEYSTSLINSTGPVDIIHAHDWLVAYTGRALKHAYRVPMISTIHATEYGRNHGLHNDTQRYISDVEWWLTYESWKAICCSNYMEAELMRVFNLPKDKIKIIPNGVNPEEFKVKESTEKFKKKYAHHDEKVVFFVGRLVQEKGVQVLLEAVPKILVYHPKTKFIIAGKGPHTDNLKNQALTMGIENRVYFTGYVDDETRNKLYDIADVAVFPSLYEPFGIVALEGMAAKKPVVVADTGGLSEIIKHGVDGLKAYPGNANSLADNILEALLNPTKAKAMKDAAFAKITEVFNWPTIAKETIEVYQGVLEDYRESPWAHQSWQRMQERNIGSQQADFSVTRYS